MKTKSLTEGNPLKLILMFAIPIFFGNLFQILYSLVDIKVVGKILGADALAAVGSVTTLSILLTGFFNGLTMGFSVLTARHFGSGDEKSLKKNVAGSIVLSIVTGLVIISLVVLFLKNILHLLSVPDEQFDMAYSYIVILVHGMFVTLSYNLMANTLRALGDTLRPLIFLIISSITNVGLDIFLIYYCSMGVVGAAVATLLSQVLSVIMCLTYIWRKYPILHVKRKDFDINRELVVSMYQSGLSMGLMNSLVNFGTLVLQSGINTLGSSTIVAHTAARKVFEIWNLPTSCLGQTMATFCGQNFGAKKYDRLKKGIKTALGIGACWVVLVVIMSQTIASYLIKFITSSTDPEVIYWGSKYLEIDMLFIIVTVFIVVLRNSMQGFGDYVTPLVSSFIELLGKLVFTFVFVSKFGYWAIIWTEPIIWILMVIPLIIMTLRNPYVMGKNEIFNKQGAYNK